jgi:hypothetical protein
VPITAITSAEYPAFSFGTRPNSEIVSASVNASRAAAARTWRMTAGYPAIRDRGATDMATNSSPMSAAPLLLATAMSKSW